jgi:threonylcarbamoyladenosine tRNA methylthiotransferase MtaB
MPTVALTTLGCKLNFAETSTIGEQFLSRGYSVVEFGRAADVTVINTCTVTGNADRECRQIIRRARRSSPDSVVIVTGCYAQLEPGQVSSIDGVDYVVGNGEKFRFFDLIGPLERQLYPHVFVSPVNGEDNFGPASSSDADGRTRAFLKVQDGCDYQCSFCTIPLARGSSRSQTIDATLHQACDLTRAGYREIVLTGVNVGDYGRKDGKSLLGLLRQMAAIEGLGRLRISSIEPNLLNDDIIDFVAGNSKLCKHFHIPLQSGSDKVLREMRRRYTTAHYAGRIHAILERIPTCGIGIDVIVGFPGEGEKEFEETFEFLANLAASYLHVFTYSERPRTSAASHPSGVPHEVRARRSDRLRDLSRRMKQTFYHSAIGSIVPVLLETDDGNGWRTGLTDNYIRVAVPAHEGVENTLVWVRVTGMRDDHCTGTVVSKEPS